MDTASDDHLPAELRRRWDAAVRSPDWAERVVQALQVELGDPGALLEAAQLIRAWAERDDDGGPVLRAVYDHPYWPERTGLRVRLDEAPFDSPREGQSLEHWMAAHIAFEIAEPLGRVYDLLVPDEQGTHWWGHGYRDIFEHPDFGGDYEGWVRRQEAGWQQDE